MRKNQKYKQAIEILLIFLLTAISVLFGISISLLFEKNEKTAEKISPLTIPIKYTGKVLAVREIEMPAVLDGEGILGRITVILEEGSGRVLLDTTDILVGEDTADSARNAVDVAFNFTGKRRENYNIIFKVDADAQAIEGGSAGAAMAIALISALDNLSLRKNAIITGTLNHDGTIGPASAVPEKVKAGKEAGKKFFLVPYTQSMKIEISEKEYCRKEGNKEICTIERRTEKVNLSELYDINIVEVATLHDALPYFIY